MRVNLNFRDRVVGSGSGLIDGPFADSVAGLLIGSLTGSVCLRDLLRGCSRLAMDQDRLDSDFLGWRFLVWQVAGSGKSAHCLPVPRSLAAIRPST